MTELRARAVALSNIAFVKYWGNSDQELRLPSNGSISMNLAGLETMTEVLFDDRLSVDILVLNGKVQSGEPLIRITRHLDHIRRIAGQQQIAAQVTSTNTFPTGAGIASSASAFASLTVAACSALNLELSERQLSTIARLGSGSASRSIPAGFVEWYSGGDHMTSYAESIAAPDHWELVDFVAVISTDHKAVGSGGGHRIADTSVLQQARVSDAPRRLEQCRDAIRSRNVDRLIVTMEEDALLMHSVMMTSTPSLIYWHPATLHLINIVRKWRHEGLAVGFTIDAGPNVHVITMSEFRDEVRDRLHKVNEIVSLLEAKPGGATRLIPHS